MVRIRSAHPGTRETCLRSSRRAYQTVRDLLAEPKYALTNEDRAWIEGRIAELEASLAGLNPKCRRKQ